MNEIEIISIIANGSSVKEAVLRRHLSGTNILIAADGGAEICRDYDLDPHYIIGDLDSVSNETIAYFSQAKIIHNLDQETTDLEKALVFSESFDPEKIRIFGAAGSRSDHFISNLLLFLRYPHSSKLEIYDDRGCMIILEPGAHQIEGRRGDTVSLFAFTPMTGLNLTGFRYTPAHTDFTGGFCGISNELLAEKGVVSLKTGRLLLYRLF